MTSEELNKIKESLEELSVDSEIFNWGPSYNFAKQRQQEAIAIVKKYLSKTEGGSDWWQDMENSTKGF